MSISNESALLDKYFHFHPFSISLHSLIMNKCVFIAFAWWWWCINCQTLTERDLYLFKINYDDTLQSFIFTLFSLDFFFSLHIISLSIIIIIMRSKEREKRHKFCIFYTLFNCLWHSLCSDCLRKTKIPITLELISKWAFSWKQKENE